MVTAMALPRIAGLRNAPATARERLQHGGAWEEAAISVKRDQRAILGCRTMALPHIASVARRPPNRSG